MFNARAETITTSPAFRDAFVRKRCLVPVDSFYEWKREGTVRQPYRIVRRDGRPLALAGLWAGWKDPATAVGPAHLHDRDHDRRTRRSPISTTGCRSSSPRTPGLAGSTRRRPIPVELLGLLVPNDDVELEVYAVDRAVNDVRRDGPELIAPLG